MSEAEDHVASSNIPAASEPNENQANSSGATSTSKAQSGGNVSLEFEPPLACVRRLLKNSLPSSTNVGKDASSSFARACGIFVIYITTCANDFARENRRTTITANDVLAAAQELGFQEFLPELRTFLEQYRLEEQSKKDAKKQAAKRDASAVGKEDQENNTKRQKSTNSTEKSSDDNGSKEDAAHEANDETISEIETAPADGKERIEADEVEGTKEEQIMHDNSEEEG